MKTNSTMITRLIFAGVACLANHAIAQDESNEPHQSGAMEIGMAVIDGDGVSAPMIFATGSEMSGDGPADFHFIGGDGGGILGAVNLTSSLAQGAPDPFSLLGDPSVQKDLELVGDQLKQLQDLQKVFTDQMKEQIGDLSKGKLNPERFKGVGELVKKLREEQQLQMKNLLLPHQIERLQQVALQRHMDAAGTAGALASEKLVEELGITDEQKDRLKKREKELRQQIAEKIKQLKQDAQRELLQELTAEQREKLKTLTGEKFKSNPQDWAERMKLKTRSAKE